MALKHANFMDVINLHPEPSEPAAAGSVSLLKQSRLQLMRLMLASGQSLPQHAVPGDLTIQCLSGTLTVETPQRSAMLNAGQLLALEGGTPHTVHAQSDAALLLTLLLPES